MVHHFGMWWIVIKFYKQTGFLLAETDLFVYNKRGTKNVIFFNELSKKGFSRNQIEKKLKIRNYLKQAR